MKNYRITLSEKQLSLVISSLYDWLSYNELLGQEDDEIVRDIYSDLFSKFHSLSKCGIKLSNEPEVKVELSEKIV